MAKIPEGAVPVYLTREEISHLLIVLRLDGYREKKDLPKSLWNNRNDSTHIVGRAMKRLRKAYQRG